MPDPATELIDVDDLREIFAIKVEVVDQQLEPAILAGSRRLRRWVGDDAYNDAIAESPTDETRKAALVLAEAHLAMHYAVLGLNTGLRQEGMVRTEKVEGDAVITYLSPTELMSVRQQYIDAAEELARDYMTSDGTPSAPFAVTDVC